MDFDVGVFWVVMRVLACGGLGVLVWEVMTQQVAKRKNIEVSGAYMLMYMALMIGENCSGQLLQWPAFYYSYSYRVCSLHCIDYRP